MLPAAARLAYKITQKAEQTICSKIVIPSFPEPRPPAATLRGLQLEECITEKCRNQMLSLKQEKLK